MSQPCAFDRADFQGGESAQGWDAVGDCVERCVHWAGDQGSLFHGEGAAVYEG